MGREAPYCTVYPYTTTPQIYDFCSTYFTYSELWYKNEECTLLKVQHSPSSVSRVSKSSMQFSSSDEYAHTTSISLHVWEMFCKKSLKIAHWPVFASNLVESLTYLSKQKFCNKPASKEPFWNFRTTDERARFILQIVTAGNGTSVICVDRALIATTTGDEDHFSYTFDMK